MAIGLFYGADGPATSEAKDALYAQTAQFVARFAEANGALRCRDLLGIDLNSDAGRVAFDARNLGDQRCVPAVRNATQALLELLDDWGYLVG